MGIDIVSRPRRGGKTTELIKWMRHDPNGIMVCIHTSEAERLRKEYPDIEPDRFLSMDVVRSGTLKGRRLPPTLFFDNLDMMLIRLFPDGIPYMASVTED